MITEAENALFAKWQSRCHDRIVVDGVIDEQLYLQSNRKTLFLLKEVNDEGGGGWDLREFVRDGGRAATWKPIVQRTKVIRMLPERPSTEELENAWADESERKRLLRSIAVMNLKKTPGEATANSAKISSFCKLHAELLRQQYGLYKPDLVILCGPPVTECFEKHVSSAKVTPERIECYKHKIYCLRIGDEDQFAVDWWHPQQRGIGRQEVIAVLHDVLHSLYFPLV